VNHHVRHQDSPQRFHPLFRQPNPVTFRQRNHRYCPLDSHLGSHLGSHQVNLQSCHLGFLLAFHPHHHLANPLRHRQERLPCYLLLNPRVYHRSRRPLSLQDSHQDSRLRVHHMSLPQCRQLYLP
jgi:hypothetical protein